MKKSWIRIALRSIVLVPAFYMLLSAERLFSILEKRICSNNHRKIFRLNLKSDFVFLHPFNMNDSKIYWLDRFVRTK